MNSDQSAEEKTNMSSQNDYEIKLRKILDLLVHVSECYYAPRRPCQTAKCRQVKELIRHGMHCKISGDCILCNKLWFLLILHARDCDDIQCRMRRCKGIKEYLHAKDCKESECFERNCKKYSKYIYARRHQQLPLTSSAQGERERTKAFNDVLNELS